MTPVLETERLLLRVPALDDLDRWAEMMADPIAAKFIGGVQPKTVVWRIVMQTVGAWHAAGSSMFSVVEKASGNWIGRVGPWQPLGWPGTEVGWGLHPDAWGKGFAFEAAVASTEFAFDTLGWSEVVHCINPSNTPSQKVAKRLGARILRKATLPAPLDYEHVDVWGQTRDEWRANRSAGD
ncbi:MAG TPA: GNAT family N-acetyltransferase [Gemmatimonadaceae bacterium]|jgi:RimJ/RimL family protein N-acetyltransferase